MKLYTTGTMTFVAIVASLLANMQREQGFNDTNKFIFWIGQGILGILLVIIVGFIILHWNNDVHVTKIRFVTSLIILCLLYVIAWIDSKYSWIFILFCGVIEIYYIRKRAGFIKDKR